MSVITIAALKAKYQTGDFPTEQDFIDLIDTLGSDGAYKSYDVTLAQSSTNAPVATELQNNVGTITYTYSNVGRYYLNSAGLFTSGRTTFSFPPSNTNIMAITWVSANQILISTRTTGGTYTDDALSNNALNIKVYL